MLFFSNCVFCLNFHETFTDELNKAHKTINFSDNSYVKNIPLDHRFFKISNIKIFAADSMDSEDIKQLNEKNKFIDNIKALIIEAAKKFRSLCNSKMIEDISSDDFRNDLAFIDGFLFSMLKNQFKNNDLEVALINTIKNADNIFECVIPLNNLINEYKHVTADKRNEKEFVFFITYSTGKTKFITSIFRLEFYGVNSFDLETIKIYKSKTTMAVLFSLLAISVTLFLTTFIYYVRLWIKKVNIEFKDDFVDDYFRNEDGSIDYIDDPVTFTEEKLVEKAKKIEEIRIKLQEEAKQRKKAEKKLKEEQQQIEEDLRKELNQQQLN
ncbi:hypothetical protein EHP00_1230 [Ecytonucleospora hepatopenaei]|uniref:Uncharacterized protein n=1 Tax=Ecytonucleospora hepatopenaei TaxID=646526 RepID=A0A1W0E3H6_9MICR|nr:hypothetical protein EHP00_1230 [Ecytonucleospora hepatopenaei]